MTHRKIIEQLNRENSRRMNGYLLQALTIGPVILVVLILLYLVAPSIDAFAKAHPDLTGWTLVGIGFSGIVYREIKRVWD